jgi:hypothetical protein
MQHFDHIMRRNIKHLNIRAVQASIHVAGAPCIICVLSWKFLYILLRASQDYIGIGFLGERCEVRTESLILAHSSPAEHGMDHASPVDVT